MRQLFYENTKGTNRTKTIFHLCSRHQSIKSGKNTHVFLKTSHESKNNLYNPKFTPYVSYSQSLNVLYVTLGNMLGMMTSGILDVTCRNRNKNKKDFHRRKSLSNTLPVFVMEISILINPQSIIAFRNLGGHRSCERYVSHIARLLSFSSFRPLGCPQT